MPLKANPLICTILAVLVAFLLGGAACSPGEPQIVVEEPEAKLSPVILGVASVFMKIVNTGNGDDRLLSARTDMPGAITELHDEERRENDDRHRHGRPREQHSCAEAGRQAYHDL